MSLSSKIKRGNWLEENALESFTGCRLYPDPKQAASSLMTNARTILHSERMEPREYKSTQSLSMVDPYKHKDYSKSISAVGPRRQKNDEKLKSEISESFDNESIRELTQSRRIDYSTVAKDSFKSGSLYQQGIIENHSVRVPTYNTDYSHDTPITYYSHEIENGNTCNFPISFINSSNPFKKSSGFSADIRSGTSKSGETHEKPLRLPISNDYKVLKSMKNRIVENIKDRLGSERLPGSAIAIVLASIYDLESKYGFKCKTTDIENEFYTSFGTVLSTSETSSISITFDLENNGLVDLPEFSNLFRPLLTPRRLELIELAFNKCDRFQSNRLTEHDLRNSFDGLGFGKYLGLSDLTPADYVTNRFIQSIQLYLAERGTLDINDFIDYYSCVSAEIENDLAFESLLKSQWLA